ncbi:MAG: molecular chaperone DjlA, partial [gamma proteobacterium symbiont of Stewartia floridana]
MSWWGKLVGGAFGFMLGGPLGAVLGAALGHKFDKGLKGLPDDDVSWG